MQKEIMTLEEIKILEREIQKKFNYDYIDLNQHFIPIAGKNGEYFHIDDEGNPLYEERYHDLQRDIDGISIAEIEFGWIHIDASTGKPLYMNPYKWISNFENGAAQAQDYKNNYFHIDDKGNPLYEERYYRVDDFDEYGYAIVYESEGVPLKINKMGTIIKEDI